MAFANRLSEVGTALETYVKGANSSNEFDLKVHDVWYNIDSSVPRTPAIIIEPQDMARNIQETGFTTINTYNFYFTVLHSRMGSESDTNQECLKIAEDLEEVLHANRQLSGLLVHSMVSSITMGVAARQKVMLRAARLTWSGWNKTRMASL